MYGKVPATSSGECETVVNIIDNLSNKPSQMSGKVSQIPGKTSAQVTHVSGQTSKISRNISHVSGEPSVHASRISEKVPHVSGKSSRVSEQKAQMEGDSTQPTSDNFSTCCPCLHHGIPTKPESCSCICHAGNKVTETVENINATKSIPTDVSLKYSKVTSIRSKDIPQGADESELFSDKLPSTKSPVQLESIDISKLDDFTLMKKIETDRKENCECREQIKEIKRALTKIKCSCTEAEIKAGKNKPFVKQASAFGPTMSGLKVALHNLQEKCKAKDKMIEAMTGELKMRTSSNTFNNVLNVSLPDVLDYDKAKDVRTQESSSGDHVPTDILYSNNFDAKMSKALSTERTKIRSRSARTCKCGKSHRDKDTQRVNLAGFEIIDIRRITQDSIIIKWKPPKSNLLTGYDIFVNGVHKSKVMSGGRTSAMIHSLDLSSTIQITIYAVTRCGRCEPPAIAIYEIK